MGSSGSSKNISLAFVDYHACYRSLRRVWGSVADEEKMLPVEKAILLCVLFCPVLQRNGKAQGLVSRLDHDVRNRQNPAPSQKGSGLDLSGPTLRPPLSRYRV